MPKVVPEYKEMAKTKIIQAAIKVFSKKGYYGSTMNEIAREVGVSKATLYTYFKSKEDILKIIGISLNQTLIDIQKSFESNDFFHVLEEVYIMMSKSECLHLSFEMTTLSSHNENIKKLNQEAYNEKLEGLKTFIKDQQNNGKIKDDLDANVLAQIITGLYTDAAIQLLIGIDETKVHKAWKNSLVAILEK